MVYLCFLSYKRKQGIPMFSFVFYISQSSLMMPGCCAWRRCASWWAGVHHVLTIFNLFAIRCVSGRLLSYVSSRLLSCLPCPLVSVGEVGVPPRQAGPPQHTCTCVFEFLYLCIFVGAPPRQAEPSEHTCLHAFAVGWEQICRWQTLTHSSYLSVVSLVRGWMGGL